MGAASEGLFSFRVPPSLAERLEGVEEGVGAGSLDYFIDRLIPSPNEEVGTESLDFLSVRRELLLGKALGYMLGAGFKGIGSESLELL